ncbi:MAG: ParB/RepB/Spo0J family partition protein [Oscillospiraceae bacterium]|nr:ParB/RepB/Spo0J family partition protein [Oscillospiraceae bacterium]
MAGLLTLVREKISEQRVVQIAAAEIFPNRYQPRRKFAEEDLRTLADSIRQNGILQPLTVRRRGEQYELIAGERRLRAAKIAGLTHVPCIVMEISDRNAAILALVENIQREDLNYFEEAAALEKLITCYGMTQEDAALQLGRAQSTVANKLRLLRLTESERTCILENHLTERHARALLRLSPGEQRVKAIQKIVKLGLNVEKTELMIDDMIGKAKEQDSLKRRAVLFKDVRLFTNTINKAIETMQAAGIPAASQKMQFDDYIEYRIRIPLIKRDS